MTKLTPAIRLFLPGFAFLSLALMAPPSAMAARVDREDGAPAQPQCGSALDLSGAGLRARSVDAPAFSAPPIASTGGWGPAADAPRDSRHTNAAPLQTGIVIPNDLFFWSGQPNMKSIKAMDAWGVTYGASDVVVAVISSGVDLTHPDLVDKLWRNAGEVPGNGRDDDGNGYVDDVQGWNFAGAANGLGPEPWDFRGGRGTLSAGIISANTHNHIGVAGTSWGARIMPLRVLTLDDHDNIIGYLSDITDAICYAADNGAKVVFIELWLQEAALTERGQLLEYQIALQGAIDHAHEKGAVVVAAAGDCGEDAPAWCGESAGSPAPILPAALRFVIGVQAADADTLVQRRNASKGSWVDLTAPGEEFVTTSFGSPAHRGRRERALDCEDPDEVCFWKVEYAKAGQTTSNFGAAHVAGAAAVLLGLNPRLSPLQVERALCDNANRTVGGPYASDGERPFWNERYGCGVLDLEKAVDGTQWIPHLLPGDARLYTTGEPPGPAMVYESANLNDGAWELHSDAPWLRITPGTQITGQPSRAGVAVDLDLLAEDVGGIQAGGVYSAELQACPIPEGHGPCQPLNISVRVVPTLDRLLLPNLGNR